MSRRVTGPNFRVEIEGRSGTKTTELHLAASREALEALLQPRVDDRRITKFRIKPYDFDAWEKKARTETANLIRAKRRGEPYDFDERRRAIWGEMKDYLRVRFNGKCAYCDARFDVVAFGDVEHYRPKRRVVSEDGKILDHPGYYWLAYDLDNLLPSCLVCNQAKKRNRFPLRDESMRARKPLPFYPIQEVPLLLNADRHKPVSSHLKFITGVNGTSFGTVEGIDDIGRTSSEVYDLNREGLIEARRERQRAALARVKEAFSLGASTVFSQIVRDCVEGRAEFAEAVLSEIVSFYEGFFHAKFPEELVKPTL
jgi:hypothetical protein